MKKTDLTRDAAASVIHLVDYVSAKTLTMTERKQYLESAIPGCIKDLTADELQWVIYELAVFIMGNATSQEWDHGQYPGPPKI